METSDKNAVTTDDSALQKLVQVFNAPHSCS